MCTTQQVLSQRFPKVTGAKVVWVLIHSTQNPPDEEEKRESEKYNPILLFAHARNFGRWYFASGIESHQVLDW